MAIDSSHKARRSDNLFDNVPAPGRSEAFETLFENAAVRIERIVSHAHASPDGFWYDQPHDEWVMVVRGEATLAFADGDSQTLTQGDWTLLPAHCRHRVASTTADTIWLACHMKG